MFSAIGCSPIYDVGVDLPDLEYFAEGKTYILLRHLQAAREWKVFIDGQKMVCCRRQKKYGRWNDSYAGFHSEHLDEYSKSEDPWFPIDEQDRAAPMNERNWQQTRYLFRFEEKGGGPFANWFNRSSFRRVGPRAGKVRLKVKRSDQGIQSYLAVGQNGLWFEFLEQTWHEPRKKTRIALKLIKEFLSEIRKAEKEIEVNGYASKLLLPESVRQGTPSFEVKQNYANVGYKRFYIDYTVQAWINPGTQGYVYLKVFDLATAAYLSKEQTLGNIREYIGWSENPVSLFLYSDRIGIRKQTSALPFDARFELWLHPSNGSPERKVIEKTLKVTRAEK